MQSTLVNNLAVHHMLHHKTTQYGALNLGPIMGNIKARQPPARPDSAKSERATNGGKQPAAKD